MVNLQTAIYSVLCADPPMTVRQCFYALTVEGVIPKTEAAYKGVVIRLLSKMRREGMIPYSWISDNTRWMHKSDSYRGLEDFLEQTARFYRRDLWADAAAYVEIWCEKDALAGVLLEETAKYDVPLMVSRGFSSDTYLQGAGETIRDAEKPAYIYHFGDHGPQRARSVSLHQHRHGDVALARSSWRSKCPKGLTPEQIEEWHLPSRPTKRENNTHARDFKGDSVELDAIPAAQLRLLVKEVIERHIDLRQLAVLKAAEKSERSLLAKWATQIGDYP